VIEVAIRNHYTKCRRNHDDNEGWFQCEARAVGKADAIAAAFALADAVERWRLDNRYVFAADVLGPADQRLMEAMETYRETVAPW
jgi:hypothetical protein